ncbi:hypothetical protein AMK09_37235 [Streptomyces sp. CB02488]|uniref:hypothetical protein n=1 Tax=Streptomyces sp. CB02488 TaxID=1703920 RepID=UPI00093A67F6|nr:hypothetical protein [Streptomyces sp. CB02488]OKK05331.1 hypothetical protein AMK09_37235 [Streptomyces sp. CB02488]
MSDDQPIPLEGIPVFTGNLATLDVNVTELASAAESVATTTGDVHSSFGGLHAFYRAPEAEQLFATTKPVVTSGHTLESDLTTIAGALRTYSDEVYPLVEKLKEIRRDAGAFLVKANADDKWREDGDLVDENNHRRDEIAETLSAFQDAEIACHNKIVALVCALPLHKSDGSDSTHQYGFDAESLKHAEGLPWGDPLVESTPWWQVWEHGADFVTGFFVDGVGGTLKGLGTLVGTDGWDAAKQAWTGLGKLATGLALSNPYMGGLLFWSIPDADLPAYLRDSRNAVKETGKALLAWDQWGENPSRAAGAVTFNVVTTVFTGGTGSTASGAGKAALAAKALSTAGKVGRLVDPMTYVFKGAGMGLTKISDVMASFKGLGTTAIPPLPEGALTLPEGGFKLADGTLHLPEGSAIPDSAFEVPSNSFKLPDGTEIPAGAIDLGDGVVRLPEGMAPPAGALRVPEGALKLPEGTTALPESATRLTDLDGSTVYVDGPGNLLKEDGTLQQHHTAAKRDGVAPGAETPAITLPPVLVGAHTVGGNADGAIRMGDDLGGAGRAGDDATGPTEPPGGVANSLPSGSADYLPSNKVNDGSGAGRSDDGAGTAGGSHGDRPVGNGDHAPTSHPNATDPSPMLRHEPSDGPPGHIPGEDVPAGGLDEPAKVSDEGTSPTHMDPDDIPLAERDIREPGGNLADDAARRLSDPIRLGDTPLPPAGPGNKVLGTLEESRVTRNSDGLITLIDGRKAEHFLKDLSFQRAEVYKSAKEAGTFSRKKTGACVGVVMDSRTGVVVEAINGKADDVIPADQVHPTVAARDEGLTDPPAPDEPLGHAEVKAVNELLWERRKQGLPDDVTALQDLRASVEFPFMQHRRTELPVRPAAFCANCERMLDGVDSSHGKFTGNPPTDENWIP